MLATTTYSQQMTEVITSTSSFDQLNWRGTCCIFDGENRQLKFYRTPYPNYHFKEQKCFYFCHDNYYCFRKKFRTILHWHWHAFTWPLAPASNDGKIITFLPSRCEWSRYRRLHIVGRLLVVITSFCPSCEAALTWLPTVQIVTILLSMVQKLFTMLRG